MGEQLPNTPITILSKDGTTGWSDLAPSGEALDVVHCPSGAPTGWAFDKIWVHAHGLWHRDVHVWVTNGTALLQQQRHKDKAIMPGQWDISVGGHVAAGESYVDAAVRETAEELGIEVTPDRLVPMGKLALDVLLGEGNNAWQHRTVGDNYVLHLHGLSLADITPQPSEVTAVRWCDITQLEADLASPATATRHAAQPMELWALGIAGMRLTVQ